MRTSHAAAAALALALAACGGDPPAAPRDEPPPVADTAPPALTGFTPAGGLADPAPFEVVATFDEDVTIEAARFRSALEERAVPATAEGARVTVTVPLVDAFESRVRLDVRDRAGNATTVWVGDWHAQPLWIEFLEPGLGTPFSGVVGLWVNFAGPATLPTYVDGTHVGDLRYREHLAVDTTAFADGPHTFWFVAPGYQRTAVPFEIRNAP